MTRPHFFLAMVLAATASTPLVAEDSSGQRAATQSSSQDATSISYGGKLKCNDADNDGTSPYVLVDKWGMVRTYVRPEPGLDLQPYVERQVWIESTGTATRRDGARCITAGTVSLGDRPTSVALHWLPYRQAESQTNALRQPVRQTAYEEPAVKTPKERIPTPQPIPSSAGDSPAPARVPEPAELPREDDFAVEGGPGMMDGVGPEGPEISGGGCAPPCEPPCGRPCARCCCPVMPYWVRFDTLLWWTRGMQTPPLVTTGPSSDQPGYIGSPGTVILAGADRILGDMQVGGRLQIGTWLNGCGTVGVEGDYLALGGDSYNYQAWSNGDPILSRPFFDTNVDELQQNVENVAEPGTIAGSVSIDARTWFMEAGGDLRFYLGGCQGCWSSPCDPCTTVRGGWRADLLLGYRYLQLRDRLGITEELTTLDSSDTSYFVQDEFDAKNQFNGGEIGLIIAMHRNRWSLEVIPKIAFGNTYEKVNINGSTVTTDANGDTTVAQGGLLALPTNIGNYSKSEFAVVPQIALTLGYQLTPRLEATFGYSFLYWSRVARAGNQIDFSVDDANIPGGGGGGPNPKFSFYQTSYWAQGINLGLGYRW